MITKLTNPAGHEIHIKADTDGGTPTARISLDGQTWPLTERFSSGFGRDMFIKGYIAYMATDGYTPADTARPFQVGDRVTTPNGPGTVTQAPSQMASGWTVRVQHNTPATASGHARYNVTDISHA